MKKIVVYVIAVILICTLPVQVSAKDTNKKALDAYKKFLKNNVSSFIAEEGDWYTKNRENYKKCSQFMVLDLDKNGIPELITYHPVAYKQGYLCVYTYKSGKVVRVKNTKNKAVKIDVSCNAAGWYDIYACKKGHLHTDWSGGMFGCENSTYTIKKGKLTQYLYYQEDLMEDIVVYKKYGKTISASKYYEATKKCVASSTRMMRDNTIKNRNKYVK